MRPPVALAQRFGVEEHRLPDFNAGIGILERCRHHADDLHRPAVERNHPADDGGVRLESPSPQPVTQHHDLLQAGLFLRARERPAHLRGHAKQRKETGGDDGALEALGFPDPGEVEADCVVGRDVLEGVGAIPVIGELAGGHGDLVGARPVQIARNKDEAVGVVIRERAEEHGVDDRENRRIGADAERQRQDDDDRKPRMCAEGAAGVAHIAGDPVERAGARGPAPDLLIDQARRFLRGHTGRQQLFVSVVEMLFDFFVHVVFVHGFREPGS